MGEGSKDLDEKNKSEDEQNEEGEQGEAKRQKTG